ncbi:MAG: hypothetical protein BWX90_00431 [bacterium ADurb.Bin132]|nr:MAG: hypothetical protein BWX90_00431 [bacterium ADurb.Bin132]
MCGINNHYINIFFCKLLQSFKTVSSGSDCCTNDEPSSGIFCRIRVLESFFDVFDGDQSFKFEIFIYNGEFFYAISVEYGYGLIECCTYRGCYQFVFCHDVFYLFGQVFFEHHVPVCYDANENTGLVGYRDTRDGVFSHHVIDI